MKLSDHEMQVVENWLVNMGLTLSKEEKAEQANELFQLRVRFKCDNHELHRIYSEQKVIAQIQQGN